MKLKFRQGIVRSRLDALSAPSFLSLNTSTGVVGINITNVTLLVTAAHKSTNFLIEEVATSSSGWGPFVWDKKWGTQSNPVYYLYWDINLGTGAITKGYTPYAPIVSATAPTASLKVVGTHWYDLNNNVMFVSDGTFWQSVCRVFAGTYFPGQHKISHFALGSQVGITSSTSEYLAGFIILGNDQKGLLTASGELMTSETDVIIKQGGYSSPVTLEALSTSSVATEPIPAFYCVTVTGLGKIGLASSSNVNKHPVGLVADDVALGESGKIITNGVLFNEQWNWNLSNGKELYCGTTGELVQKTSGSGGQRIAFILDARSIMVDLDDIGSGGSSGGVTSNNKGVNSQEQDNPEK